MLASQEASPLQSTSTNFDQTNLSMRPRKMSRSLPRVEPQTPSPTKQSNEHVPLGLWTINRAPTALKEESTIQIKIFRQKLQLKHHRVAQLDTRSETQTEVVFAHFSNTYSTYCSRPN